MADDWIKVRHALPEGPKMMAAARMLQRSRAEVFGMFVLLLQWADRHTEDGTIDGVGRAEIDTICGADGVAEAFESVGWIGVDGDGVTFHDWEIHNGSSAKRRAASARRQQKRRVSPKNEGASRTCHTSVTQMSRTERDKSVTREEKSREEKNTAAQCAHAEPEISIASPEEPPDPDHPGTVAVGMLADALGMSRASVGGAGGAIAREARKCPCEGHGESEVIRAAFAVVAAYAAPEWGVGQYRGAVVSEIRKAAENGELPKVWAKGERTTFADRARSERESKIAAIRAGGAA